MKSQVLYCREPSIHLLLQSFRNPENLNFQRTVKLKEIQRNLKLSSSQSSGDCRTVWITSGVTSQQEKSMLTSSSAFSIGFLRRKQVKLLSV